MSTTLSTSPAAQSLAALRERVDALAKEPSTVSIGELAALVTALRGELTFLAAAESAGAAGLDSFDFLASPEPIATLDHEQIDTLAPLL